MSAPLASLRGAVPSLRARARPAGPTTRSPATLLRTAASVPAVVLRLGLLTLCLAAGGVLAVGPAQWWVVLAVALAVAVRPHAALLALGVGVLIGMLALFAGQWWQLPVLVLVTHAILRLGALADAVAWDGRVELGVLRDALPGFVVVQAVAQAAAVLALVLDGAAPVPWLVVGGVGALAALSWVVVRELRADARR